MLIELAADLATAVARLDAVGRGEVPPDVSGIDAYRSAWNDVEEAIDELGDWLAAARG